MFKEILKKTKKTKKTIKNIKKTTYVFKEILNNI